MFPAQALAEEMLARGWRVKLSTDARGARYTQAFPPQVEIVKLASATFARGGVLAKLAVPLRIAAGVAGAVWSMLRDRPAVVAGFGGYPSIPALSAAWLLRRPRLIHEQNGILGRVNMIFSRRVDLMACGTWPTTLPDGVTGVHVGNPVRGSIADHAGAPYTPPSEAGALSVLVIGGSQGARILSDIVPAAVAVLPETLRRRVRVAHQARGEDEARVRAFYAENDIAAEVQPFFSDVPERMAAAQLVVSRAGASSLADLAVIGRPAVLVPYAAAAGDHQNANARGPEEAGAAVVVTEDRLTRETLAAHLERLLSDAEAATRMAQAARDLGKPAAARDLADLVQRLAGDGLTSPRDKAQEGERQPAPSAEKDTTP